MFEPYLFELNVAVSTGLKNIKALKNFVVKFQQYEYAIILGEIEKHFLSIEQQLGICNKSIPSLTKGLTLKGDLFYNKIFAFNIFHNWKNIPENFIALLKERKTKLNKSLEFNDNSLKQLISLNEKLAAEEGRIQSFFKLFKDISEHAPSGLLTIKCYTQSNYYESTPNSFDHAVPFYKLEFALNDFISNTSVFYDENQPQPDFLLSLPIKFNDKKVCLLFSHLATNGLLAWEDLIDIDSVEIDLDLKYQFS